MHKNATKCNKTQSKWCINKHGASKIVDTFGTYQLPDRTLDLQAKILASSNYKIFQPGPRQTLLDASATLSDLRGPKSSKSIPHINKGNEEETEPHNWTYWWVASRDHDSVIHRRIQAGRQENKGKTTQNTLND
jgi:hypothetical protein